MKSMPGLTIVGFLWLICPGPLRAEKEKRTTCYHYDSIFTAKQDVAWLFGYCHHSYGCNQGARVRFRCQEKLNEQRSYHTAECKEGWGSMHWVIHGKNMLSVYLPVPRSCLKVCEMNTISLLIHGLDENIKQGQCNRRACIAETTLDVTCVRKRTVKKEDEDILKIKCSEGVWWALYDKHYGVPLADLGCKQLTCELPKSLHQDHAKISWDDEGSTSENPAIQLNRHLQIECNRPYTLRKDHSDVSFCAQKSPSSKPQLVPPIGKCIRPCHIDDINNKDELIISIVKPSNCSRKLCYAADDQNDVIVRLSCKPGYALNRQDSLVYCNEDHGEWLSEQDDRPGPWECLKIMCRPVNLKNSHYHKQVPNTETRFGTMVQLKSEEGYELIGPANSVCLARNNSLSGDWVPKPGFCRKMCNLTNIIIANGRIEEKKGICSDGYCQVSSEVVVKCANGYKLHSGHGWVKCEPNGSWTWNINETETLPHPVCVPIRCLSSIYQNSNIKNETRKPDWNTVGSEVRVSCKDRYVLEGPKTVKCIQIEDSKAEWLPILGKCVVTCKKTEMEQVSNGVWVHDEGSCTDNSCSMTASFEISCINTTGANERSNTAVCNRNGVWEYSNNITSACSNNKASNRSQKNVSVIREPIDPQEENVFAPMDESKNGRKLPDNEAKFIDELDSKKKTIKILIAFVVILSLLSIIIITHLIFKVRHSDKSYTHFYHQRSSLDTDPTSVPVSETNTETPNEISKQMVGKPKTKTKTAKRPRSKNKNKEGKVVKKPAKNDETVSNWTIPINQVYSTNTEE